MNKLNVIGIGPGSVEYILPVALEYIIESEVIIGGARNLEALDDVIGLDLSGVERIELRGNLDETVKYIRSVFQKKQVSVVASGDPGFYGILNFLRKNFTADELNVVPGVSSVQYLCAKLALSWEGAAFASLHGRSDDILNLVRENSLVLILTDENFSAAGTAKLLADNGFGSRMMHVGQRLSYDDEVIHSGPVEEFSVKKIDASLCVVAVTDV